MRKFFVTLMWIGLALCLVMLFVGAAIEIYYFLPIRNLRQTLPCGNGCFVEIWDDAVDSRYTAIFARFLDSHTNVILETGQFDCEGKVPTPIEYRVLCGPSSTVVGIAGRTERPWDVRVLADLSSRQFWTQYQRTKEDWFRAEDLIADLALNYPSNAIDYYNDRPRRPTVTYVPIPSTNTNPALHQSPRDL